MKCIAMLLLLACGDIPSQQAAVNAEGKCGRTIYLSIDELNHAKSTCDVWNIYRYYDPEIATVKHIYYCEAYVNDPQ